MIVDFEITLGLNVDIKKAVAAEGIEHVIEERHAGFDRSLAAAVDIQIDRDIRFFGLPFDRCRACHKNSSLSESRFHRTRVIVQAFETGQMGNLRRQGF